jgi:hypothetical protein
MYAPNNQRPRTAIKITMAPPGRNATATTDPLLPLLLSSLPSLPLSMLLPPSLLPLSMPLPSPFLLLQLIAYCCLSGRNAAATPVAIAFVVRISVVIAHDVVILVAVAITVAVAIITAIFSAVAFS